MLDEADATLLSMRNRSAVTLMPLGGLGEIGMNCFVLEQADGRGGRERLVIDCGARFPFGDDGVELLHPCFDALTGEIDRAPIAGLVLTHGHDDHIGAVPFLAQALTRAGAPPLDIRGPEYAIELCRERLEEVDLPRDRVRLQPTEPGEPYRLGGFAIEPVRVAHSTAAATGLIIRTRAGTVVHSGDFKLAADPLDGEPTDEVRLERAGDEGVALLLSDSTNALVPGSAGSERTAAEALDRLIRGAPGVVVVALFASNVQRMAALGAIAQRLGRRLCLLGRGVRRHAELARLLGLIDWPSDLVVAPEIAATLPRARLLYLATGTQGEPRGALARIAGGQHGELRLGPDDTVILSSRIIPGAETAVHALCDALLRLGVRLVTSQDEPAVHVSGHACRDEQERMIALTRPRSFIPLHGTLHHLRRHAETARAMGVADAMVLCDGERAALGSAGLERMDPVPSGEVAIAAGKPIEQRVLRERQAMARAGLVVVALGWAADGAPEVQATAFGVQQRPEVARLAAAAVRAASPRQSERDLDDLVRRAVRRRLGDRLGLWPEVQLMRKESE